MIPVQCPWPLFDSDTNPSPAFEEPVKLGREPTRENFAFDQTLYEGWSFNPSLYRGPKERRAKHVSSFTQQ